MSGNFIYNAANTPLNKQPAGDTPDVSGALTSYYQPVTFVPVTKTVNGFMAVETANPIVLQATIQPFSPRQLALLPIGERAWTYFDMYAAPYPLLQVDSVVMYLDKQTRVMFREDFRLYGYVHYQLVQDWTGAGPNPVPYLPNLNNS